ncbi:MAG: zinc ribbon domain-containing protein [Gemmatimonadaceae bacterium]
MDDLDRLYRRLVHNVRASRPEYLTIPFSVRELYEQIVPYRHNRRELAIETNDDYETAIARLLSGERAYVVADPAMQESLRREIESPTGDPGIFKDYADATITLSAAAAAAQTPVPGTVASGMNTPASIDDRDHQTRGASKHSDGEGAVAAFDAMSPSAVAPSAAPPAASLLESLSNTDVPDGCRFCGGTLPEGRETNYCPHCGENLRTRRCPACGAEMDTSWKFCITCGRAAT